MEMNITQTVDSSLTVNKKTYTINDEKDIYLLKTIHIPKKERFLYAFVGGMWYSKHKFSLANDDISLPYPFTSYYTLKILDKIIHGEQSKSCMYVKMPVFVIQFPDECYRIQFYPCIKLNNQDVFPFLQLKETAKSYDVSYFLSKSFTVKRKDHAWLGRGKKTTKTIHLTQGNTFDFTTEIKQYKTWDEAIITTLKEIIKTKSDNHFTKSPEHVFTKAKNALWRSYDQKRGTFLQLPWRETPGFTFVDSSYSLLSYEAVRLDYFSNWYQQTNDKDFETWRENLHQLFINPAMHTIPRKQGKGIIWYNMTTLTQSGLAGYFYMDTGYAGYPGGQATIDFHLLNYLHRYPDKKLEHLIQQSITYLLSTQKKNGSWPMAIKQEGLLKFRPERLQEYTSYGGTAEAIRALLKASSYFKNDEMKAAAINGLKFQKDKDPICYNGLRDIGVMEPEAFSAVSIINAFLDGYEYTNDESYLSFAKIYTAYTFPWIYQWSSSTLPFHFNFHPISYSITPRLSPYETAWIISTYQRIAPYMNDVDLKPLNRTLFNQVTSWISKTGGLSEGVFPNGFSSFNRLPMEQTFSTVELMNSALNLMENIIVKKEEKQTESLDSSFRLKAKKSQIVLFKNGENVFSFNANKAMITHIHQTPLTEMGITFSFYGCYQKRIKRKIKKYLRGNIGKFINGSKDVRYVVTGVKPPNQKRSIHLDLIQNHIISSSVTIHQPNKAHCLIHLPYHTIKLTFLFSSNNDSLDIKMNIEMSVNTHDLPVKQIILFPLIGAKPKSVSDTNIDFASFSLQGDCSRCIQKDAFTAINQTLSTNWTHGGVCKKEYTFSIPLKNTSNNSYK